MQAEVHKGVALEVPELIVLGALSRGDILDCISLFK